MQEELEDRLNKLVDFLKNNTSGLFGAWNPLRRGAYFKERVVAESFACSNSVTKALVEGMFDPTGFNEVSGSPSIDRFFAQYKEVFLPFTQPESMEFIIASKPDAIIDVPTGYGTTTFEYIDQIRSRSRRSIPLICIDHDESRLIHAKRIKHANSQFFIGKIVKGGEIQGINPTLDRSLKAYSNGILEKGRRYSLIGICACNYLSDYIGDFIVKNEIDSFVIYRCCYGGLLNREHLTNLSTHLPINKRVISILKDGDEHQNLAESSGLASFFALLLKGSELATNRRMRDANIIITDKIRQLISLDLAVYLEHNKYHVGIEKEFGRYLIYGKKAKNQDYQNHTR